MFCRGDNSPLSRRPLCRGVLRPIRWTVGACSFDVRSPRVGRGRARGRRRSLLQCGICGWKSPTTRPAGGARPRCHRLRIRPRAALPAGRRHLQAHEAAASYPNVFAARCNGGGEASRPPLPPGGMAWTGRAGRERDGVICCCGALVERRSPRRPAAACGRRPSARAAGVLMLPRRGLSLRAGAGRGRSGAGRRGEGAREARALKAARREKASGGRGGVRDAPPSPCSTPRSA